MKDSLPWTPMNRPAKFHATSFILDREIRNHTNKQTKLQTLNNSDCYLVPVNSQTSVFSGHYKMNLSTAVALGLLTASSMLMVWQLSPICQSRMSHHAFTPKLQSITKCLQIIITHPAEARRLIWPKWLVTHQNSVLSQH